jgi:hypothetical protein
MHSGDVLMASLPGDIAARWHRRPDWRTAMRTTIFAFCLLAAATAGAQDGYGLHGNGPVVIVPNNGSVVPGYGYGGAVAPYGRDSGVVVTPNGALPYGRYNKDAARDAFRINNAVGGARAADEAAARNREPLTPLNPMPGGLK